MKTKNDTQKELRDTIHFLERIQVKDITEELTLECIRLSVLCQDIARMGSKRGKNYTYTIDGAEKRKEYMKGYYYKKKEREKNDSNKRT